MINDIEKSKMQQEYDITKPATEQAKKLEGAYAGFQPKPAVEIILVVMKPLSEKTFVDQALANGKGVTWLDDCRIPYQSEDDLRDNWRNNTTGSKSIFGDKETINRESNDKGRFPANLLVSDDVLNDGSVHKSTPASFQNTPVFDTKKGWNNNNIKRFAPSGYNDSGSYSRYFDLDAWTNKTYPFLIIPKASKTEKGTFNTHATVKPLRLMSYLITMGSREGDVILDPFCGSGTTLIAAHQLHRKWIGIEISEEYCEIARKRLQPHIQQTKLN
jgi:site-specific DNA-methyltransferase (adenine-specific)